MDRQREYGIKTIVHQQHKESAMGLYIPQKSQAERLAEMEAAKTQIEQINPEFVLLLMRGSPLPDEYDGLPAVREFRRAYQAVRTTQLHF